MSISTVRRSSSEGRSRTAILVLGMHRSGTSALTRVLSLLGAGLPQNLYPPGDGNPHGHWEPLNAVALNDRILARARSHVNSVLAIEAGWFQQPEALAFLPEIEALIESEYKDAPLFIIKDPRICVLFPLWSSALTRLGIEQTIVITVRNTLEVAYSLLNRQQKHQPEESWTLDRCGLLWLRYMVAAETLTRAYPRSIVNYNDLLDDWRGCARRIGDQLGMRWEMTGDRDIDAFLSRSERHYDFKRGDFAAHGELWASTLQPAYAAMEDAARDRVDLAAFHQAADRYRDGCRIFGNYVAVLEADRHWQGISPGS